MGRLFWKIFLFIWLGQMAAVIGTGAMFWIERQQFAERFATEVGSPLPRPVPDRYMEPPPPHRGGPLPGMPPPPPNGGPGRLPLLPLLAGLVASLFCALGLAWYFAKPIRCLRAAFDKAADGDLEQRIGPSMGQRRDELADLGQDFDRMTARLQALVGGQRRLLHDVSHEMRSPLARLQAAIGLARQQPERTEDSLLRIERESERMNLLVGELLTLSRLEAGVAGEMENVDTGELLAGLVDDARFEGADREVIVDYRPGIMPEVRANPELLHRAIENVVRNALRYSSPGDVLSIEAGLVGEKIFRISITDQGPGVPPEELEAIFKPFYRADGQTNTPGYGLGLAIAQRIIVAADGKIEARLGQQGGLVVTVELPVR